MTLDVNNDNAVNLCSTISRSYGQVHGDLQNNKITEMDARTITRITDV